MENEILAGKLLMKARSRLNPPDQLVVGLVQVIKLDAA
jgi:hypothetical protein